jgi:hypothetical protein
MWSAEKFEVELRGYLFLKKADFFITFPVLDYCLLVKCMEWNPFIYLSLKYWSTKALKIFSEGKIFLQQQNFRPKRRENSWGDLVTSSGRTHIRQFGFSNTHARIASFFLKRAWYVLAPCDIYVVRWHSLWLGRKMWHMWFLQVHSWTKKVSLLSFKFAIVLPLLRVKGGIIQLKWIR